MKPCKWGHKFHIVERKAKHLSITFSWKACERCGKTKRRRSPRKRKSK